MIATKEWVKSLLKKCFERRTPKTVVVYNEIINLTTSGGTAITYDLPDDFGEFLYISLSSAGPQSSWSNGALVTMYHYNPNTNKVELTTNQAQKYSIVLSLTYIPK